MKINVIKREYLAKIRGCEQIVPKLKCMEKDARGAGRRVYNSKVILSS